MLYPVSSQFSKTVCQNLD